MVKMLMKNIKQTISIISTILIVIVLFGVIFVQLGIATPSPSFYLEMSCITILVVIIKFNWYNWAEDRRSNESDIVDMEKSYDNYSDAEIKDIYDFEKYLKTLNDENRKNYVLNKLKDKTPKNCKKYYKLKSRYERWALRWVREIKSSDVKTRGETHHLADSKNYQRSKKISYQIVSTIVATGTTILLSYIAFEQIMISWENLFRYLSYICTMCVTGWTTILVAFKNTEKEIKDYLMRLQFIVDKYVNYKQKGGKIDGN